MAEIVVKLVNGELAGRTAQSIAKEVNAAATALKKAEVGTQAWVDANKKLEDAKQLQVDYRKQIDATNKASETLRGTFGGILQQIPGFSQLSGVLSEARGGVGGLTSGFGLLRGAIIATGIGALILLLTSLVSWFTKTERGADLLEKTMRIAGAAVNVLRDRAAKLIDALIAFVNGRWTEAAERFGEATRGVTQEIIAETEAAGRLADALDQLEEKEGQLILIRSRSEQQISALRLLAKDETLTLQQRAVALEQAIAIQRRLNKVELEAKQGRILQALEVANLDELTQKYGVTLDELIARGEDILTTDNLGLGESTQEDLNKAFEALAAYNEAQRQSADQERTIVTELNTLRRKARREDNADAAIALQERQINEATLESIAEQQRIALAEQQKARAAGAMQATIDAVRRALTEEAALRRIQAEEIAEIERGKQQIFQDTVSAFQNGVDTSIALLSMDENARKRNAGAIKTFESGKVAINGLVEISEIAKTFAALGPIGQILAAVRIAFAAARTSAAIQRINRQQFAEGGYTGPGGKYQPAGIVHAGEVVWSQEDVARFGGVAAVEAIRPTAIRGYATGGPVDPFNAAPATAGTTATGNPVAAIQELTTTFMQYAQAMDRRIDRIQVNNNVQDTDRGLAVLNRIRAESDV